MIKRIKNEKHPIKFLFSRILWKLGLCRLFIIRFPSGIKMRFYPTAGSASFWVDKMSSVDDGSFVEEYLSEGDTYIDIGANIGYLSLIAARKVGKTGKVISIEPHPKIYSFLNKNIKLNNFNNTETYNIAIGNEEGVLKFSDSKSDEQNFITKEGTIEVRIKKLDDVFLGNQVDFLKIDTEGYELFVLNGAKDTLLKTKLVFLESYQKQFDRYSYNLKDILDLLLTYNFRIFRLISAQEIEEVDSSYSTDGFENLVAVKDLNFLKSRIKDMVIKEIR